MSKELDWDIMELKPISYLGVTFTYEAIPYKITRYGLKKVGRD